MTNRTILVFPILVLLFFVSCDKEDTRMPDFLVKFATVIKKESSITIQLDNGNILTPEPPYYNLSIEDSSRVIINYTPLENSFIKINSIQQIFLGGIEDKNIDTLNLNSAPLKKVVVDKQGDYLNLQFLVDYHSKPHSVSLFRDTNSQDKTNLYLSYSRENDPPGAPTKMYVSFKLGALQNNKISIFIETDKGERRYDR